MRKIIGGAFMSLDGVVQAPGGPEEDTTGGFDHGGWIAALFEEGLGNQVDTLFKPPFDLLLGRRTYDIFASYWPFVAADDEIGQAFSKNRKYVLTRSGKPLDWQGSERVADLDALARIKAGDGPNLIIQGSSTLYPQLMAHGLIDRLVVMFAPVVLGGGKKLFGEGTPSAGFKLVEQRATPGGFILATYDVDGPVRTATFASPDPSEAELVRRARMEGGSW
ncbi:MAG: dihydrofolate reductase family protein [Pseudomonadota bacterium]|nr:dihydrofolate reductase family protein [Pseudomonadota bacterium]